MCHACFHTTTLSFAPMEGPRTVLFQTSGSLCHAAMRTKSSGRRKLSKLMSYHVLGYINRDEPFSIMHGDSMTYHLRDNCRTPRPRPDDAFFLSLPHQLNFLQQMVVKKRPLLYGTTHSCFPLP